MHPELRHGKRKSLPGRFRLRYSHLFMTSRDDPDERRLADDVRAPTTAELARARLAYLWRMGLGLGGCLGSLILLVTLHAEWTGPAWLLASVLSGVPLMLWRCPRCRKRFLGWGNLRMSCVYCDLQLAVPPPRE
jgi:hypothetical protein